MKFSVMLGKWIISLNINNYEYEWILNIISFRFSENQRNYKEKLIK